MPKTPYLRIAHLYAHLLNIYGDRGNILTLRQRAHWRDIKTTVETIGLGDPYDPDLYDLFFIGGGQDKQQKIIAEDLVKQGHLLKQAANAGAVILSVCGGYQLLGHYYRPLHGDELRGISLLDAYTVAGTKRMIGNVIVKRSDGTTLVGFENHSGKTYLAPDIQPLGRVIVGNGNNGEDKWEGASHGTVFGTYLHGSLLPKNPSFADQLLTLALKRRYGSFDLPLLNDDLENQAHKYALALPA